MLTALPSIKQSLHREHSTEYLRAFRSGDPPPRPSRAGDRGARVHCRDHLRHRRVRRPQGRRLQRSARAVHRGGTAHRHALRRLDQLRAAGTCAYRHGGHTRGPRRGYRSHHPSGHRAVLANVTSYWSTGATQMRSTDGSDAIILAHLVGTDSQVVPRAQAIIDRYAGDHGVITTPAAGDATANVDVRTQVGTSLAIAESIAVPITMVLLLLAFGSVVSALLPLVIGLLAIVGYLRRTAPARPAHRRVDLRHQPDYRAGPRPRHRLRAAAGQPVPRAVGRRRAGTRRGRPDGRHGRTYHRVLRRRGRRRAGRVAGVPACTSCVRSPTRVSAWCWSPRPRRWSWCPRCSPCSGPRVNRGRLPWSPGSIAGRRRRSGAGSPAVRCAARWSPRCRSSCCCCSRRHRCCARPVRYARPGRALARREQPAGRRHRARHVPGQRLERDRRGEHWPGARRRLGRVRARARPRCRASPRWRANGELHPAHGTGPAVPAAAALAGRYGAAAHGDHRLWPLKSTAAQRPGPADPRGCPHRPAPPRWSAAPTRELVDSKAAIGTHLPEALALIVAHHVPAAVPVHRQRDPAAAGAAAQRAVAIGARWA